MSWKDSDNPAKDINTARMRAAYYRARYVIHRPFLYYALHDGRHGTLVGYKDPLKRSGFASRKQLRDGNAYMERMINCMGSTPCDPSLPSPKDWKPPMCNLRDLSPQVRRACKICVHSAIQNTIAFDGIEDRLVIPNIFGTAHS
jgi:hypothetical protein